MGGRGRRRQRRRRCRRRLRLRHQCRHRCRQKKSFQKHCQDHFGWPKYLSHVEHQCFSGLQTLTLLLVGLQRAVPRIQVHTQPQLQLHLRQPLLRQAQPQFQVQIQVDLLQVDQKLASASLY